MSYKSSSMSIQPGTEAAPGDGIVLDRLRSDILELAEIGKREDAPGVHRLGFTDEDMQARHWLMEKITQAGGSARMDEAGNVIGRWFDNDKPCVMTGSHIDSVPAGGMFDGTLGVLAGLECARVLSARPHPPQRPFEIVAFADEEGRFGGMFGVQALTGTTTLDWVMQARAASGAKLADCMREQGFEPERALDARREPGSIHAFCELHIEQGPVLEQTGIRSALSKAFPGSSNGSSGWAAKPIMPGPRR